MAEAGSVTIRAILDASDVLKKVSQIKGEMKDLGEGSFSALDQGAEEAAESVKKVGSESEKASSKIEKTEQSASRAGDALRVTLAGAAAAAGAAVLATSSDYETAQARIQAALGLSSDEAERFKSIGTGIYEEGWGQSLDQVTDALIQTKSTIRDVDEQGLDTITRNALALSDVFGADVNETIRGTNALMEGFGLTAEEASDLMAAGMQRGLNYTDELGDNLSEYAGRWGDAGMTASQYFSLLEAGTANGAYNLDKVGDFLNEFLTSLSDGRMEENIGRLSSGTQEIFENFKEGKATAEDVLNAVIADMRGMTDETERASIASDLWSSLGEDNAMKMILAMGDVEDTFTDVAGASDDVAESMEETFAQKARSAARTFLGSLEDLGDPLLNIAEYGAEIVSAFAGWFDSLGEGGQRAVVTIAAIAAAIGPVSKGINAAKTAVQTAGSVAKAAQSAFTGFADGLGLVGSNADEAGKKTEGATGKIKASNIAMTAAKGAAAGLAMAGLALVVNELIKAQQEAETFNKATDGLRDAVTNSAVAMGSATGTIEGYGSVAGLAAKSVDELVKSQAEWADTLAGRQTELNATLGTIDAYAAVIEELAGKTDLTAEEQARLKAAVDGVNDACGTTWEVAQDASGAYQIMQDGAALAKDEIYRLLDAQKAQAQFDVAQQGYTEAIQKQADAAATLAAEQEKLARIQEQVNQCQRDNIPIGDSLLRQLAEAETNTKKASKSYDEASDALENYEDKMTIAQMAMEDLDEGYAPFISSNELLQATLLNNGYSLTDFRDQLSYTGISVEQFQQLNDQQLQILAQNYDGTMMSIVNTMRDFGYEAGWLGTEAGQKFASGLSGSSWQALQAASQVSGVAADELARLAYEAGISGNDAVQTYAAGIRNGVSPADAAAYTVQAAAAGQLSSLRWSTWGWGSEAGNNFAAGVQSAYWAARNAANAVVSAISNLLGHSVPKEGPLRGSGRGEVEFGEHAVQNFARGMLNATPELEEAATMSTSKLALAFQNPISMANDKAGWVAAPPAANYSYGGSTTNEKSVVVNMTINATVREEADIDRISREIAKAIDRED